jgi:Putative adhesin
LRVLALLDGTATETSVKSQARREKRIIIAAVLIGVVVLGLALSFVLSPALIANSRDFSYPEQPNPPAGSAPSLSITNVNGKITLSYWTQSTVSISGTVTARGLGSSPDQVVLSESNINGAINFQASFPSNSIFQLSDSYEAQIVVFLPVGTRFGIVKVETVNGGIDARISNATNVQLNTINGGVAINCTSCINVVASTNNGPVAGTFSSLQTSGQYTMTSVNGNVAMIIPLTAGFTVHADTSNGTVDVSGVSLQQICPVELPNDKCGRVGGGGASVKLHTINGQVTISIG